ncbi:MAG: glycosyltransferase family 2 protein [Nitrospinae bacterium]|nr:glycosyltransferase family 2 protein [Nitrospinota bacterium]
MTTKERFLIVIPVFNEEKNIEKVLKGIQENLPKDIESEILVINDGSTDGTSQKLRNKEITVITHPFQSGYGTTLQTSYKYAASKRFDYLIQIDGDGQHHPFFIKDILGKLKSGEGDVVIGSRFMEVKENIHLEGNPYRGTFARMVGMKLFAFIVSFFTGLKVTDPTSGYIGMNREVFSFLKQDIYPVDYPDADVIIMLCKKGFNVIETPVLMSENKDKGTLHRGLKPVFYIYKMFLSILVTLLRKH